MPSKVFKPYNKKKYISLSDLHSVSCDDNNFIHLFYFTVFFLIERWILSLSFLQIFKTYAIFNCEWSNYHGHVSYKLNFLTLYLHIFACCRCPSCLSSSPCTSRGTDTHMLDFWEYFAKSHDTVIVVNIYIVICP